MPGPTSSTWWRSPSSRTSTRSWRSSRSPAWGKYDRRFKIGGVKITIDGSPQGRTAAFTTPYLTGGPGGEKNWSGELFVPQEVINQGLKKVYGLGVPVTFHANGDAAIDALFEAHEFAAADDPTRDRNVTVIHAQFTRKDQIPKYVQYKMRPSFYTLHTYYFAEAHIKNRGQEQAMYISPMRDAIDAGLHPTNHTDAVVAPLDQMFMLWSAVNRISRAGAEIGPDQRVTPLEGLKAMTIWAAEQYGEQASKGSLEAGKLADMVVLSGNPLKVEPDGDQGHPGPGDVQGREVDLQEAVAVRPGSGELADRALDEVGALRVVAWIQDSRPDPRGILPRCSPMR